MTKVSISGRKKYLADFWWFIVGNLVRSSQTRWIWKENTFQSIHLLSISLVLDLVVVSSTNSNGPLHLPVGRNPCPWKYQASLAGSTWDWSTPHSLSDMSNASRPNFPLLNPSSVSGEPAPSVHPALRFCRIHKTSKGIKIVDSPHAVQEE